MEKLFLNNFPTNPKSGFSGIGTALVTETNLYFKIPGGFAMVRTLPLHLRLHFSSAKYYPTIACILKMIFAVRIQSVFSLFILFIREGYIV